MNLITSDLYTFAARLIDWIALIFPYCYTGVVGAILGVSLLYFFWLSAKDKAILLNFCLRNDAIAVADRELSI